MNEDKNLSEEQLEKVIQTLLEIENIDDRPLYNKIKNVIAARRATRRKRVWLAVGAAAAAVAVVWIAVTPDTGGRDAEQIAEATGVRLTVSDGRYFDLTGDTVFEEVLNEGDAVIKAEEGTLFIESNESANSAPSYHTLEVPKGMQYDLVLSDGSKVWLNSDTRLRFPTGFVGQERKVELDGEGYFEVRANDALPFIVEIGDVGVTALGTSFNVRAYEYHPAIVTTLFSGSVSVNKEGVLENTVIRPGQQASMDKATGIAEVREVDVANAQAWRINIINLEKRTLEEITNYMSKIYDVNFRFVDESARHVRFRGNVTRSDDIGSVLERIAEVGDVRFTDNGSQIEIFMK